jgi:hypothetical protein
MNSLLLGLFVALIVIGILIKYLSRANSKVSSPQICPQCKLANPPSAQLCDCGHAFELPGRDSPDSSIVVRTYARASTVQHSRRSKVTTPASVSGKLAHQKNNNFGSRAWADGRETTTECHICLERHFVFSMATDEAGKQHRCCYKCLKKFGGDAEYERFIKGSDYAALEVAATEALEQLRKEFPDENLRPYGEKTLIEALDCPIGMSRSPWQIIEKIKNRAWTQYDLARIEGRPEPPSRNNQ